MNNNLAGATAVDVSPVQALLNALSREQNNTAEQLEELYARSGRVLDLVLHPEPVSPPNQSKPGAVGLSGLPEPMPNQLQEQLRSAISR